MCGGAESSLSSMLGLIAPQTFLKGAACPVVEFGRFLCGVVGSSPILTEPHFLGITSG